MARILVVGGSFGGLTAAFELQKRLGSAHSITLLSNSAQFVFIPSLPWVAMGWRDTERITFGIERPLGNRGIRFVHGAALSIDTAAQNVVSTAGDLPYDYLVIATGSDLDYSTVPGLDPALGHCATIFTWSLICAQGCGSLEHPEGGSQRRRRLFVRREAGVSGRGGICPQR